MLRGTHEGPSLPEEAVIPVGQTIGTLYILHAASHCRECTDVPRGEAIGHYLVAYEDGSRESIPIICGEDVRDWFAAEGDERPVSRGLAAYRVLNSWAQANGGRWVRVYLSAWKNPHPERKIMSIEYTSTNTNASPFCMAMTIEKPTAEAKGGPASNSHAAPFSLTKSGSAK